LEDIIQSGDGLYVPQWQTDVSRVDSSQVQQCTKPLQCIYHCSRAWGWKHPSILTTDKTRHCWKHLRSRLVKDIV